MADPITVVSAATTAFTQAHQIIRALLGLKIESEVLAKVTALQSLLAEAQSGQLALLEEKSALLQRVRELEKELQKLETWSVDSKRYLLHEVEKGVVVYALKESDARSETPHWLCTNCFANGRKSILVRGKQGGIDHQYRCPSCDGSFFVHHAKQPTYVAS